MEKADYDFEIGDEFSDLKLIVENKIFHVHKAILTTSSPVFKRMFCLQFKESLDNQVTLPQKKVEDILELLKYLYPTFEKKFNESNIHSLLDLSEEYDINHLRLAIEKHLIKNIQNLSSCRMYGKTINDQLDYLVTLLKLSDVYRMIKLKLECIAYISKKFDKSQIDKNSQFSGSSIDVEIKLAVFREKSLLLEEQAKLKETKCKQMQDEILKQKFEINSLKKQLSEKL
jgi:hypothetical protein